MSTVVELKQKEAKTLRFTCTNSLGVAANVSGATLSFLLKASKLDSDLNAKITKNDAAFDKTNAASGIVLLPLSATDLNLSAGTYYGEMKTYFSSANIDKSNDITVIIQESVFAT